MSMHEMAARTKVLGLQLVILLALVSIPVSGIPAQPTRINPTERRDSSAYGSSIADDVVFETDPETGSLIVITDDETNEMVREIVDNLDRPIPQVLIKVLFLEVTLTDDYDLGAEGSFSYGSDDEKDVLDILYGLSDETTGGMYKIIDDDLSVTLHALETVGKMEVLSRPSVLAKQNEEAVVMVGQEFPFVENSRVTSDGQTINTVTYEDIGIILTVTPNISPDNLVTMQLEPEISTLTNETVPISDTVEAPVFAKRSAETVVMVPDGKTVVIGGMMEDNLTESVNKVPFVSEIPLFGKLFQRKQVNNTKTELLIFVTPHVVRGGDQLDTLSCYERGKSESAMPSLRNHRATKFLDDTGGSIQPQEQVGHFEFQQQAGPQDWPEEVYER